MAVKFDFDQDVETVFNALTDPDVLVERSLALGELSADCEVEEFEDETVVHMTREVKRDLPSVLAKMFNPVQTMKMVETWRPDGDDYEGEYTIEVVGQPVTLNARFSLRANGSGCTYEIKHGCKAKIPLVAGKVEKFIQSQAVTGAEEELAYLQQQLG